jgi:hypothetical protein
LIQYPGLLVLLQLRDESFGGVTFEIPDSRQSVPGGHQVQMVVQDGLGMDFQALVLKAKPEGAEKYLTPVRNQTYIFP